MWIILIIICIIFSLLIFISYKLAEFVVYPTTIPLEDLYASKDKINFVRDYPSMKKEEYIVTSFDGLKIHTIFVPAKEPSNKYVIITHGYTANRYGSLQYLHMFRSFGYNCIIYDDRGHGENGKSKCTMGYLESKDLIYMINDTYERYGQDIYLGLHGESMGSGLQIMSLAHHPKVHFIVNDCGYATLIDVLTHKLKQQFHLPGFLAYTASMMCQLLYGYSFTKVRPIDALSDNMIPICFMHGANDTFIDPSHSKRMQKATPGYSELHLFPGADHAQSIEVDEAGYYEIVDKFLHKVYELEATS